MAGCISVKPNVATFCGLVCCMLFQSSIFPWLESWFTTKLTDWRRNQAHSSSSAAVVRTDRTARNSCLPCQQRSMKLNNMLMSEGDFQSLPFWKAFYRRQSKKTWRDKKFVSHYQWASHILQIWQLWGPTQSLFESQTDKVLFLQHQHGNNHGNKEVIDWYKIRPDQTVPPPLVVGSVPPQNAPSSFEDLRKEKKTK